MPLLLTLALSLPLLHAYLHIARKRLPPGQTPTGAGLLWPIAFLATAPYAPTLWAALLGLSLLSAWDDATGLPVAPRLLAHLTAAGLLLWSLGLAAGLLSLLVGTLLLTGWLNAYNFMDGINGMAALYGLVLLGTLGLAAARSGGEANTLLQPLAATAGAVLAFTYFNVRRRAQCFAGDAGAFALSFILAWALLSLWRAPLPWHLLALPALYAVDTNLTLLLRLRRGANIFEGHREHLYELFAYSLGIDHRRVALGYAGLQLAINAGALFGLARLPAAGQLVALALLYSALALLYLRLRRWALEQQAMPSPPNGHSQNTT